MGRLSRLLRNSEDSGLLFFCPGCKGPHQVKYGTGPGPRWEWNKDAEAPTFSPSVLVTWTEPAALGDVPTLQEQIRQVDAGLLAKIPQADRVCHSFVREGMIEFLGDCTHALKGQTVPLAEWPGSWE